MTDAHGHDAERGHQTRLVHAKRLPAELAQIDAYLDDERFISPWRGLFSARLGRPSVPVDWGKPGFKLHLVCDGQSLPLAGIGATMTREPPPVVTASAQRSTHSGNPRTHPGGQTRRPLALKHRQGVAAILFISHKRRRRVERPCRVLPSSAYDPRLRCGILVHA